MMPIQDNRTRAISVLLRDDKEQQINILITEVLHISTFGCFCLVLVVVGPNDLNGKF